MPTKDSNTVDYRTTIAPDELASVISNMWVTWKGSKTKWETERKELRNYLFATDTTTTTNANLPWKNSTTRPKLTQLRDNLHANYMAALFPHEDFFKWEAQTEDGNDRKKADIITAYMKNKIRQSDFMQVMSTLVYDYIDYGNAFAEVIYKQETSEDPEGGLDIPKYSGPRVVRISPFNIVMNSKANNFHNTPHIVRSLLSLGELAKMRKTVVGTAGWIDEAFNKALNVRSTLGTNVVQADDPAIEEGFIRDGLGTLSEYYASGQVELLEFNGDIYDVETQTLYENRRIIIADRAHIVFNGPYESWLGRSSREHVGWRQRPDNLWAMGPLDNLVGMQYRIDHLENLKADVFDQIAHPTVYHKGEVEDWESAPGARIYGDIDSDVRYLTPDATALNADFQIQSLENSMEEMAGAPRQAMGIRTPGEKTAFEVQTLENNTGRIFHHKTAYFDANFVEPLLNQMLSSARQNMDASDIIRMDDPDYPVNDFKAISKDDLKAKGKLVPKGARHFARQAQVLQNLNGIANSAMYQDPAVNVHWSGLAISKLVEDTMDIRGFNIVQPNIRVMEQVQTQSLVQAGQQTLQEDAATPVGPGAVAEDIPDEVLDDDAAMAEAEQAMADEDV